MKRIKHFDCTLVIHSMLFVSHQVNKKLDNSQLYSLIFNIHTYIFYSELSLEHLYWGKSLNKEFDLRYLSQSSRMTPFLTSDETINRTKSDFSIIGKMEENEETLEKLEEEWHKSTISSFGKYTESEIIKKKRLENIKWRKMAMKLFGSNTPSSVVTTNKQLEPLSIDDLTIDRPQSGLFHSPPRRRAFTNAPVPQAISQMDPLRPPSMMNISLAAQIKSLPSSPRSKSFIDLKSSLSSTMKSLVKPVTIESPRTLKPTSGATAVYDRMVGKIGKGATCVEFSDHGTGDFRSPSFLVVSNDDGASISPLKYKRHRIFAGKEVVSTDLPSLRVNDPDDATTLIITMGDYGSGVEVDLIYGMYYQLFLYVFLSVTF